MAYSYKSAFALISIVLSIYIMRSTDLSPGSVFSSAFRSLASLTRPTISLCDDVDLTSSFSSQQIDQANAAMDSVKTLRGGNKLLDYFSKGEKDAKKYAIPLIPVAIPWVVMLVFSLLCCFSLCCNWCYLHGCCRGNKICSCCKAPKHQARTKLFVTLSSVFLVLTLGAAITGLIFSRRVAPGVKRTYCSIVSLGLDLAYGVPAKDWMGLSTALVTTDVADVNTKCGLGKSEIDDFVTDVGSQTANRAAPDHTGTYQPEYIANLGSTSDASTTYAGAIWAEFSSYNSIVVGSGTSIDDAISDLKTQEATIQHGISSGLVTASSITTSISNVMTKVQDNQDKADKAIKGLNIGLIVFFLVYLVLSALSIFAILLLFKFKVKIFSKCLHLGWCLFILLTILGFILSAIFFTLSVVVLEGCDTIDVVLGSQPIFNSITTLYLNDNNDYLTASKVFQTCYFGDGNMLAQFGLTDDLVPFDTIYTQIDAVNAKIPITTATAPDSVTIPPQIAMAQLWQDGRVPDAAVTTTDLQALNSATNSDSNSCTSVKDTWLLNSVNCTSSQGSKFVAASGSRFDFPSATCVGFDAWDDTSTTHDITARYTATEFPGTCANRGGTDALTYVRTFVTNFKTNRDDVDTIFTSVLSGTHSLNTINSKFSDFMDAIMQVLTDLKNTKQGLQLVQESLVGKTYGLIPNSNCTFIQASTTAVTGALCTEFITGTYFTSVMIIVMSLMSLFSAMWVFVLLKRVHLPKYEVAKTHTPTV